MNLWLDLIHYYKQTAWCVGYGATALLRRSRNKTPNWASSSSSFALYICSTEREWVLVAATTTTSLSLASLPPATTSDSRSTFTIMSMATSTSIRYYFLTCTFVDFQLFVSFHDVYFLFPFFPLSIEALPKFHRHRAIPTVSSKISMLLNHCVLFY